MDIVVNDAEGLPEKAYVSIRAGEVRKQVQYKPGVVIDLKASPKYFVVDVFEKVGSKQVSVSDILCSSQDNDAHCNTMLELPGKSGAPIKLGMQVKAKEPPPPTDDKKDKRVSRHQAALEAKTYLDTRGVQKVLQTLVHELLSKQPEDAIGFMIGHLQALDPDHDARVLPKVPSMPTGEDKEYNPIAHVDEEEEIIKEEARGPGLGFEEYPGFPADACPHQLPDLSYHHNSTAVLLRKDPALYAKLKDLRTRKGVSLSRCIKPGMDNEGHPMVNMLGAVAGDDECYDLFAPMFEHLISQRNPAFSLETGHPSDVDLSRLSTAVIDSTGMSVLSVQVKVRRNLQAVCFPPAISRGERHEVERVLVKSLLRLQNRTTEWKGKYFPLRGSSSYIPKPKGMSASEEEQLRSKRILIQEPEAQRVLSSGTGRLWPEARGVFSMDSANMVAWVNEEDHLRLTARREDSNLQEAFRLLSGTEGAIRTALKEDGHDFAESARLGFLTSWPHHLGSGLAAEVHLRLALLARESGFHALCQRLHVEALVDTPDTCIICNANSLGSSQVEQVNAVVDASKLLLELEQLLIRGKKVDLAAFPKATAKKAPQLLQAPIDFLRRDLSEVFAQAALDGSLGEALQGAKHGAKHEKEIQAMRISARRALAKACETGKLEDVLRSVMMLPEAEVPAEQPGEVTKVRDLARGILEDAVVDGRLAATLAEVLEKPRETETLRSLAKDELFKALKDGRLEATLEEITPPTPVAGPEASPLRGSFCSSSGKAPDLLPVPLLEPPEEVVTRESVAHCLLKAASNGRLQEVIEEISMSRSSSPAPSTRSSRKRCFPGGVAFSEDVPGLGEDEVPGFPADVCPVEIPDLEGHHSIVADVLRSDPSLYERLRRLQTPGGIGLAKCIKPGLDIKGHPMIKTVGAVAGDAASYDVFQDLFDPIISARHGGFSVKDGQQHTTDLDANSVSFGGASSIDPTGKYVVAARVEASRNLAGMPFPPSLSREERMDVERQLFQSFDGLTGHLAGEYFPVEGSSSLDQCTNNMSSGVAVSLQALGLSFPKPDSALLLSSGVGRHWPEARGVFTTVEHSLVAWVNEEDHVLLTATETGPDLQKAFATFCEAERAIGEGLKKQGHEFARHRGLGYLSSAPSRLGTGGFKVSLFVRLPLLSAQDNFKAICRELKVSVRETQTEAWGSLWRVCGVCRLGISEAELATTVGNACQTLVKKEAELEAELEKLESGA